MLKKVYLELTEECNLDCTHCFRKTWAKEPQSLPDALLNKLLSEINSMPDLHTVVLGGIGEPFIAPHFDNTLKALSSKEVWITTNGMMFREHLSAWMLPRIKKLIVSADGMHESMLKSRGIELDEWINNILYLNKLRKKQSEKKTELEIQFVAAKNNIHEIFELMDMLAHFDIQKLYVSNLLPVEEAAAENILYTDYPDRDIKKLFDRIRNYSFRRGLQVVLPEIRLKTERRCAFVDDGATYITATGKVAPCYRLSHDGSEYVFGRGKKITQYSFGDINKKSLTSIWDCKDYRSFRDRIYNNHYPSCIDCDLAEGCDLVNHAEFDCHGNEPSCGDCLWSRNIVFCH